MKSCITTTSKWTRNLYTNVVTRRKKEVCVVMIFNPLKNEFRDKRLEREKRQAVVIIIFIPPSQNYESIFASENEEYPNVNDKPFCRDVSDRVLHSKRLLIKKKS